MENEKLKDYELTEPRFIKAIKIEKNITDIYNLPCCAGVSKSVVKGNEFQIGKEIAHEGDWITLNEKGEYNVVLGFIFEKKYKLRSEK